ncbi:MAG: M48 family metalloprotease [Reichenbachiella sp.]
MIPRIDPSYIFLLLFLISSSEAKCQWEYDYTPKKTFNSTSTSLIRSLTIQGAQQIMLLSKEEEHLKEYLAGNTIELINLVKNEKFIDDDSLKAFLHRIVKNITRNNDIVTPRKVLVLKSTKVNAYSLGDGTLVICNGLLAKLNNEKELAFILAHEIAHWQFNHFKQKIIQNINAIEKYKPDLEFKSVKKSSYSLDAIRNVKRWHYNRRRFSREVELQADSLALILYSKAYDDSEYAAIALQNLDSGISQSPFLGAGIFKDLNFKEFPFNKDWATLEQVAHYDISNYQSFHPDSSLTHPVIEYRIAELNKFNSDSTKQFVPTIDSNYAKVKMNAMFENIGSARSNGNLDQAIYFSLRLKQRYPNNAYLTQELGDLFLTIYNLKIDEYKIEYDEDTVGYNREQRYVYNFVHNIKRSEIGELSYYFMNKKENFNREREEHYYLLYEICSNTARMKMRGLVKKKYTEKFKEGDFLEAMD